MSLRYPPATWRGDGRRYGSLTTRYPLCLILHTTETRGVPGYNNGNAAPHVTYDAPRYRWVQHQTFDAWVGAMKAGRGPISANAKAVQVEIVCYSDKRVADLVGGLWVGHMDDQHHQDLADFVVWLRLETSLPTLTVYQPAPSWLYGAASPLRLSWPDYLGFDGITAHGAAPDNDHWNTGVLDIRRIADLAAPPANLPVVLPILYGQASEDVRSLRARLRDAYGLPLTDLSNLYDDDVVAAVKTHLNNTGHPQWSQGFGVGSRQWEKLTVDYLTKKLPTSGGLQRGDSVTLS